MPPMAMLNSAASIPCLEEIDYCTVERNGTPDVAAASSRRHHRKSKFGLRHAIKLIELYCMTKSEFGFSIA